MAVDTIRLSLATDLSTHVGDFERSLAARNRTPRAIEIYGQSARRLIAFLQASGMPTSIEKINWEHLERRGDQTGIGHVYPHQFRHTMAHRWMAEGGDLMMIAGAIQHAGIKVRGLRTAVFHLGPDHPGHKCDDQRPSHC
jgi:site-specific recombinase XerD